MEDDINTPVDPGVEAVTNDLRSKYGLDTKADDSATPVETKDAPASSDADNAKDTSATQTSTQADPKVTAEPVEDKSTWIMGKYKTQDDLIAAKKSSDAEAVRLAQEREALQKERDELASIAEAGKALAQQLADNPELLSSYQRIYGKEAVQQAQDANPNVKPSGENIDPAAVARQVYSQIEAEKAAQAAGEAFGAAAQTFEEQHPELTFDKDLRGKIGAVVNGVRQAFPEKTLDEAFSIAHRTVFPDAAISEAKKEVYAQVRTNSIASNGPGGTSSAPTTSGSDFGLSNMEKAMADKFGLSYEAYSKRKSE